MCICTSQEGQEARVERDGEDVVDKLSRSVKTNILKFLLWCDETRNKDNGCTRKGAFRNMQGMDDTLAKGKR